MCYAASIATRSLVFHESTRLHHHNAYRNIRLPVKQDSPWRLFIPSTGRRSCWDGLARMEYDCLKDRSKPFCSFEQALTASTGVLGAKHSRRKCLPTDLYALPGDMCHGESNGFTFQIARSMLKPMDVKRPELQTSHLKDYPERLDTAYGNIKHLSDINVP